VSDYRVQLDVFDGPLDLLLYLVRKEEVDIYDIPIAQITDQYIQTIELMKNLDIEVAGEFLVMAATLMEIKSAMLLPRADPESVDADEAGDPRAELVRQLLEYKKFKDAANLLNAAASEQNQRQGRPNNLISQIAPESESDVDMEQVSIWDLLEAFDAICRATGQTMDIRSIKDDTPIDLYQIDILHRLQTEKKSTFRRIFEGRPNRLVFVGNFLAILELVRNKLVSVEQAEDNDLYLRPLTDEPAEIAVQRSILAVQEEWEAQGSEPTAIPPEHVEVSTVEPMGDRPPEPPEKPSIPIEEVGPAPRERVARPAPRESEKLPIPIEEIDAPRRKHADRPAPQEPLSSDPD
jgi:segregation and condensation protein A